MGKESDWQESIEIERRMTTEALTKSERDERSEEGGERKMGMKMTR